MGDGVPAVDLGAPDPVTSDSVDWVELHLGTTTTLRSATPAPSARSSRCRACFIDSPWWLVPWPSSSWPVLPAPPVTVVTAAICLGVIIAMGLWEDA